MALDLLQNFIFSLNQDYMVIFVKSEYFERKGRASCNAGNRKLKISVKCQKNILCVTNRAACQVLQYSFIEL